MTAARYQQPDPQAKALGKKPNWTFRVLGLVQAGHSMEYIVERGRYEGTWTKHDVVAICQRNRMPVPRSMRGHRAQITGEIFRLPPRQIAVLHHMVNAASNAEIAKAAHIKEATVKADVRSIITKAAKYGHRDRIAVVVAVLTRRLIPLEIEEDEDV